MYLYDSITSLNLRTQISTSGFIRVLEYSIRYSIEYSSSKLLDGGSASDCSVRVHQLRLLIANEIRAPWRRHRDQIILTPAVAAPQCETMQEASSSNRLRNTYIAPSTHDRTGLWRSRLSRKVATNAPLVNMRPHPPKKNIPDI